MKKNRTGAETGTIDSQFLSCIMIVQSMSFQLSKNLEKSGKQKSKNRRCGHAGNGAATMNEAFTLNSTVQLRIRIQGASPIRRIRTEFAECEFAANSHLHPYGAKAPPPRPPPLPLLLAELGALVVCPCRNSYFWQNWEHWSCVHADFITIGRTEGIGCVPMRIVSAGTQGRGGGGVGETRATRWTLRPPRCGDVQPSLAGAAVSGASGAIGSRHSDTRHQTPPPPHRPTQTPPLPSPPPPPRGPPANI